MLEQCNTYGAPRSRLPALPRVGVYWELGFLLAGLVAFCIDRRDQGCWQCVQVWTSFFSQILSMSALVTGAPLLLLLRWYATTLIHHVLTIQRAHISKS